MFKAKRIIWTEGPCGSKIGTVGKSRVGAYGWHILPTQKNWVGAIEVFSRRFEFQSDTEVIIREDMQQGLERVLKELIEQPGMAVA